MGGYESGKTQASTQNLRQLMRRRKTAGGTSVAIVGAGLAGLTLAHALARNPAASTVRVFEKHHCAGGRLSTRSENGGRHVFDHGAQFFAADNIAFRRFAEEMVGKGVLAPWQARFVQLKGPEEVVRPEKDDIFSHFVGVPSMNALCEHLASELNAQDNACNVSLDTGVATIKPEIGSEHKWQLEDTAEEVLGSFDWVITATPPSQALELLPASFAHHAALMDAEMRSCFSLMLAFSDSETQPPYGWDAAEVTLADISWISVDSSKPGRATTTTTAQQARQLVVLATNEFAGANFDKPDQDIIAHMIAEIERVTRCPLPTVEHVALKRWRFANSHTRPLVGYDEQELNSRVDPEYLLDTDQGLAAVGDWGHGRAEAAFLNATHLAERLGRALR
jgi:predicted NAD/FAD-dependent oxidoreductase